ncbi:MAG: tRNA (guanosine(37)-N1)-methyltransferase TrmD [Burkholderiaceae bacterium]|nr:MAG: tRNA (guanosine(37)-N1)-methyltransferase TrmD [Burkholderiaceae bacterium]
MRFDVITLFPELIEPYLKAGINRRAFESGQVEVKLWPLREHAIGNYRRVDDRPFGGGPGMVMLVEPLERALAAIRADQQAAGTPATPVVLFTPTGRVLQQADVRAWSRGEGALGQGAVLLCGRYEGIDQRFIDRHVTHEISLGDFVLSGGELAAATVLDALARLMPGVLTDASHEQDSFENGLLDCPHYSRPEALDDTMGGLAVPEVLLSGHHVNIERWRREQSLRITWARRPELIEAARQDGRLSRKDEIFLDKLKAAQL